MSAREYYHHVMWYTVWDAKTGELVAAGTSAMCAAKLGYKNAVSFSAAVCHWFKDGKKHLKYIYQREYIPRSEVDSLIPPAPHRHKIGLPVRQHGQAQTVMDSLLPITPKNNTLWRFLQV